MRCLYCGEPFYGEPTCFCRKTHKFLVDSAEKQVNKTQASRSRPSWEDYFLGLAFLVSQRSLDPSTQHGCVLVDKFNHIVGTGYNSFPAEMNDEELPLTRPEKYPWMDHAEVNAVANSTVPLRGTDATAFVTGKPCFQCAKTLYRHGVLRWVYADRRGFSKESDEEVANYKRLVGDSGVEVKCVKPKLDWLVDPGLLAELKDHNFVGA